MTTIPPSNYATLKLVVATDDLAFLELYRTHIERHNQMVCESSHPDSGFDVFFPIDTTFDTPFVNKMVDLKIKAEMLYQGEPTAFLIKPRSSLVKTPLMLSNHEGLIDMGFRHNIQGCFRLLANPSHFESYTVSAHTRLLQICHPSCCPILVELVQESDLSVTRRGKGFGSTGVSGIYV